MKKMNILHVGNHTIPCTGGIERVIWESACEQKRRGHDVSILVFNSCTTKNSTLATHEEKDGITIHRVRGKGTAFYFMPPITELLKHAKGKDIVHVHGFGPWLDILALFKPLYRAKLFLTTHGGFRHTSARALLKWFYQTIVVPFALFPVSTIFCVGDGDRQFIPFFYQSKAVVIPNGIAVSPVKSFKKKPLHLVFVGRLSSNKRVDVLLDIMKELVTIESRAELHIVGDDWEGLRKELEEKNKRFGLAKHVIFHGKLSDATMEKLLQECDAFISASAYEGFGMTALEGMGAGCIPFLNPIPTFHEFLREGRGYSLLVDDPSASAKEIGRVLNLPAAKKNEIRSRDRAYVLHHFSWSHVIDRQISYYEGRV
jgi:alpha-1,3-mannosyltransferase